MRDKPLVYIVAAEASGEQIGAALIDNLRLLDKTITFKGIGGAAMQERGIVSPFDISPLSILGFVEALKAYPMVVDLVAQAADDIIAAKPDIVILIDSFGFMIRVAKRLKKLGFEPPLIKYVAPQVWAMREGRTKVLAKWCDHVLSLHSFDAPYFEREGLGVTYVGNPTFDTDYTNGDGQSLRAQYKIAKDAPVLAVLFGSRLSEIQNLAEPFAETVAILQNAIPGLRVISPVASHIATDVFGAVAADTRLEDVILLDEERKLDVFAAADAALACSGTVTMQLACAGVPTVLAYKLSKLTWMIGKYLYKPDFAAIVNIAAGQALMPEHLQSGATGEAMARSVKPYLTQSDLREQASQALIKQTQKMRGAQDMARLKSSARAAHAIINLMKKAA